MTVLRKAATGLVVATTLAALSTMRVRRRNCGSCPGRALAPGEVPRLGQAYCPAWLGLQGIGLGGAGGPASGVGADDGLINKCLRRTGRTGSGRGSQGTAAHPWAAAVPLPDNYPGERICAAVVFSGLPVALVSSTGISVR